MVRDNILRLPVVVTGVPVAVRGACDVALFDYLPPMSYYQTLMCAFVSSTCCLKLCMGLSNILLVWIEKFPPCNHEIKAIESSIVKIKLLKQFGSLIIRLCGLIIATIIILIKSSYWFWNVIIFCYVNFDLTPNHLWLQWIVLEHIEDSRQVWSWSFRSMLTNVRECLERVSRCWIDHLTLCFQ